MPHFEKKKVEGVNFLLAFMNIIKQRHSMPLEKNLHDPEMKNQVEDEDDSA